ERRVAQVMAQACGVDDIIAEPERRGELSTDLRDLERMGEPVAREVGVARRAEHLGLRGEAPQARRVQHPGTIARKLATLRAALGQEAWYVGLGGARRPVSRHWYPAPLRAALRIRRMPVHGSRASPPAGSRAASVRTGRAGPLRSPLGTERS